MNKISLYIIIVLLTTPTVNIIFGASLKPTHWKAIALDITDAGDSNDRGEFEAAKQAFLNISAQAAADDVAEKIAAKWEASIGKEASEAELLSLKRYPQMKTPEAIQEATVELFKKENIKNFLLAEKIKVDIKDAQAEVDSRKP